MEPNSLHPRHSLLAQFQDALSAIPTSKIDLSELGQHGLFGTETNRIRLSLGDRSLTLLIQEKNTVFPKDVRTMFWEWTSVNNNRHGTQNIPPIPLLCVIANEISKGAKQLLQERGISYFERGGSLFIAGRGVFVQIEKPKTSKSRDLTKSVFLGQRASVVHELLRNPSEWHSIKAIANKTRIAPSYISKVLAAMENHGWLETRGLGPAKERRLTRPAEVLDSWVADLQDAKRPAWQSYFVPPLGKPLLTVVANAFDKTAVQYAITHEVAAQLYTPFLTSISQVRCRAIADDRLDLALKYLDAQAVNQGANLFIEPVKRVNGTWMEKDDRQISVADPLQTYIDLMREPIGRSKEMANHLRAERIGF